LIAGQNVEEIAVRLYPAFLIADPNTEEIAILRPDIAEDTLYK
jgi:hypothetical protein